MYTMLCFVFVIMVGISNAVLPGPVSQGVHTVFETVDVDTHNNCEWEKSRPITDVNVFPFGNFVAVDTDLFDDAISCGECYELSCESKIDTWGGCSCIANAKVTVMVMDFGHDVHGEAQVFDSPISVADTILTPANCATDRSKYRILYQQVCCEHKQNIAIYNYEGMTADWLSFVIAQVRGYGSITNFYMRENGRSLYSECNRNTNGLNANWVCDPWSDDYENYKAQGDADDLGPFVGEPAYVLPIDIKITDSNGDTLESIGLITNFVVEHEFDFGSNFNSESCPGNPIIDATTTTTTREPDTTTTTRAPDTTTTTKAPDTTTTTKQPDTTTTTRAPDTTTTTRQPDTTTTTRAPDTTTTTRAPDTTTTTRAPDTTTTTTTTQVVVVEDECPEDRLDDECDVDGDCPPCMKCCGSRFKCEMRPLWRAGAIPMAPVPVNHHPIQVNEPKGKSYYDANMFGYILLVGFIAFILVNNLFIGCWCLRQRNGNKNSQAYEKYEQCDIAINQE